MTDTITPADAAPPTPSDPIGTLLIRDGLITHADLDQALAEQARTGRTLGPILKDRGLVTEGDIVSVIAKQFGMQYVDLAEYQVDVLAAQMISAALARKYQAVPVKREGNQLTVAMRDPMNVFALDDIKAITKCEVHPAFATEDAVRDAIDKYYRADAVAEGLTHEAVAEVEPEDDLSRVQVVDEDAPIIKLVNIIIEQAVLDRASDIHIDPTEKDVKIRFRVDDVLYENRALPKQIQPALTSRLKIMAELNIAERRVPQDGRISGTFGGKKIDLRTATLPVPPYGEKIVMRILDSAHAAYDLDSLGLLPHNLERYEKAYNKPYGTILITGPTGSGKSTTLSATLNIINDPTKNVITVEDPVEYRTPGVNHVQVNEKAGLTFATALRSILRCDPNIVLVGEIRDGETAEVAVKAALTGHLVLSTLHTNDAASTPPRLIDMGVEPYLVGTALDCVVAQRLARRLCEKCKEEYEPTEEELVRRGWDMSLPMPKTIFRAGKCGNCGHKGYRGRFGVHEVMPISDELERMIAENRHSADIRKVAVDEGMLTLRQCGLMQVSLGMTTLDEIMRTIA
jgi:type IV pilus assembly protein PilB